MVAMNEWTIILEMEESKGQVGSKVSVKLLVSFEWERGGNASPLVVGQQFEIEGSKFGQPRG